MQTFAIISFHTHWTYHRPCHQTKLHFSNYGYLIVKLCCYCCYTKGKELPSCPQWGFSTLLCRDSWFILIMSGDCCAAGA